MKKIELTVSTIIRKEGDAQTYAEGLQVFLRENLDGGVTVRLSDSESVKAFHEKFAVPQLATPGLPNAEVFDFREKFLREELEELGLAWEADDLHGMADALIDLVYVAHGTALMMGLPWSDLWSEVQRANMSKVRAAHAGESKRGSALDVIKPAGWTPPDFTHILGEKGQTC